MHARNSLIPPISEKHLDIFRRIYGNGEIPEVHKDALSDVSFLDIQALIRAGWIEEKKRGRYQGYSVTAAGSRAIKLESQPTSDT